jgi:putative transposase
MWGSAVRCREKFPSSKPLISVEFYTRRLPHWHPPGADFFVTWRLHGSLPKFPQPRLASAGEAFLAQDKQLDHATSGPLWLKDPQIAERVRQVLLAGMTEWHFYELHAWVIMANHVHILLRPHVPLHKALMNIKSASARAANTVLRRTGKHFWQDESYDHWVRNDQERNSIIRYIHNNPVTAGLVAEPQHWPWSSANYDVGQRHALP